MIPERLEEQIRDSLRGRFLRVLPTLRPEVSVWISVAVLGALGFALHEVLAESHATLPEWLEGRWRAWLRALGQWDSPYPREREDFQLAVEGALFGPFFLAFFLAGHLYPLLALAGRPPRARLLVTAQVTASSLAVFGVLAAATGEHSLAARYAEADSSLTRWPHWILSCVTVVECAVVAVGLVVCVHDPALHRALLSSERVDLRLLTLCGALVLACATVAQAGLLSWPTAALVAFNGAIGLAALCKRVSGRPRDPAVEPDAPAR